MAAEQRLGQERLKLDLFKKRFSVFGGTRRLLSIIARDANVSSLETLGEFRASIERRFFV